MVYVAHTEVYRGYTIKIEHEEYSGHLNPRTEIENVGTLVTWESDYGSPDGDSSGRAAFTAHDFNQEYMNCEQVGDEWVYTPSADNLDDGSFEAYRWQRRKDRKSKDDGLLILALDRQYDGGLRAYTYTDDCYNMGRHPHYSTLKRYGTRIDGVAFMTYEDARKEWGEGRTKRLTAAAKEKALEYLKATVEEYSHWAKGNIWGFVVGDTLDEHKESCWGFFGDWDKCGALEEARMTIDGMVKRGDLADAGVNNDEAEEDMDEEIAEYAAHFPNVAAD